MQTTFLWKFETRNFRVSLDCDQDHNLDLSFDETGETAAKLASGEWECVTFRVSVTWQGRCVGEDMLSESIYADVRDFRKEHIGARGRYGSYFRDMISTACAEARKAVARMHDELPLLRRA